MILLTLQNVNKSFAMNSILKDVNLTLQAGSRMGLVGVNGSGKSTLFKLISGQMEPDSGTISLAKGTRVGMLTQDADIRSELTIQEELERVFEPVREMERRLREMEAEMAEKHDDPAEFERLSHAYARLMDRFEDAGGYSWPSRIQGVLAGLGFARGRETQPANLLSGGEKTRLCLARLLLTQPELLMLDEPTNHLDLASVEWLEDTLKKYRGTVLVISHDRYFLNSVCDCMAELSMPAFNAIRGQLRPLCPPARSESRAPAEGIQAPAGGNHASGGDYRPLSNVQPRKIDQARRKAAKSASKRWNGSKSR